MCFSSRVYQLDGNSSNSAEELARETASSPPSPTWLEIIQSKLPDSFFDSDSPPSPSHSPPPPPLQRPNSVVDRRCSEATLVLTQHALYVLPPRMLVDDTLFWVLTPLQVAKHQYFLTVVAFLWLFLVHSIPSLPSLGLCGCLSLMTAEFDLWAVSSLLGALLRHCRSPSWRFCCYRTPPCIRAATRPRRASMTCVWCNATATFPGAVSLDLFENGLLF